MEGFMAAAVESKPACIICLDEFENGVEVKGHLQAKNENHKHIVHRLCQETYDGNRKANEIGKCSICREPLSNYVILYEPSGVYKLRMAKVTLENQQRTYNFILDQIGWKAVGADEQKSEEEDPEELEARRQKLENSTQALEQILKRDGKWDDVEESLNQRAIEESLKDAKNEDSQQKSPKKETFFAKVIKLFHW